MTVRELAAVLGLSKSTVADALRDKPWIKASTRELVQRRARELGYRPNPVASAFLQQVRGGQSERYRANIALILPVWGGNLENMDERSLNRRLYDGIQARVGELGYSLDVMDSASVEPRMISTVLQARGVFGVIVGPLIHSMGHLELDWSKFAAVAMGYSLNRPVLNRVVHNHAHGVRTAFLACRRARYQRIGLVLQRDSDHRSDRMWAASYLQIQQRIVERHRVNPLMLGDGPVSRSAFENWVDRERPDAVIFHDYRRIANIHDLLGYGRGKIAPVVLDRWPEEPYAGIDQRFEECGAQLVDLVSLQIVHNARGIPERPLLTLVEGTWAHSPGFGAR